MPVTMCGGHLRWGTVHAVTAAEGEHVGLLSDFAQRVEDGLDTLRRITEAPDRVDRVEERIEQLMSLNQQYLDEISNDLEQVATAFDARLDELEAAAAEGRDLDFSRARAATAHLREMATSVPDSETPLPPAPPVVTEPGDGTTPVDGTPVDGFPTTPVDPDLPPQGEPTV